MLVGLVCAIIAAIKLLREEYRNHKIIHGSSLADTNNGLRFSESNAYRVITRCIIYSSGKNDMLRIALIADIGICSTILLPYLWLYSSSCRCSFTWSPNRIHFCLRSDVSCRRWALYKRTKTKGWLSFIKVQWRHWCSLVNQLYVTISGRYCVLGIKSMWKNFGSLNDLKIDVDQACQYRVVNHCSQS